MADLAVIAVIFDFDDTLVPDSTSRLLEKHGVDAEAFWATDAKVLYDLGYDMPMAYLNLLLRLVGPGKPLGELTNAKLREFGASLDDKWYPGLPQLFDDLRAIVEKHDDMAIEFYIISGGLEEVIGASAIVKKHFRGWYGCQLDEDPDTGVVRYIKRAVSFTEKTRFIFEINKGIRVEDSRTKPHLVNEDVGPNRRVPLDRMIYVGDGLTDIPCFSLIGKSGGLPFGVLKQGMDSARQSFQKFLETRRVTGLYSPKYGADGDMGIMIRSAVANMVSKIAMNRAIAR
jgi:phosphoserine phosphatase